MRQIFFIIFILLSFSGCLKKILDEQNVKNFFKSVQTEDGINFENLSAKLTTGDLCKKVFTNSTLYVSDFVNETDLQNKSQLGFLLSNSLKVNLLDTSCSTNLTIKTLNLLKSPIINTNGITILSRDLKKLRTKSLLEDKQIAIGSYTITSKQLILFLKIVNLEDGETIASSSATTPISDEILELEGINTHKKTNLEEINVQKPFHL